MTRANLHTTLNNKTVEDQKLSADEQREYMDRSYVLLVELARVADGGANPKHLIDFVSEHPAIAKRTANALDKTIFELENRESSWVLGEELISSHKKEVQILRSILARNTSNDILAEIENGLRLGDGPQGQRGIRPPPV